MRTINISNLHYIWRRTSTDISWDNVYCPFGTKKN